MMRPQSTAFGRYLRAARLRWGHSERHAAFIRMTERGPDRWLVEVTPDDMLVPSDDTKTERVIWYDDKTEAADILDALTCMRGVRPRVPLTFVVDEQGREVRHG